MKTRAKWIVALASLMGLAWFGWGTQPVQAPLDVRWVSPQEHAQKRLAGWPKVEKFDFANVSLKEAIAQLNRCFENSSVHDSIVFRAWQEGDPVPKELHRIKSVPVTDAASGMPEWAIDPTTEANMEADQVANLVARLYNCELAATDDAIVLFPKGSLTAELAEHRFYLMWKPGDPSREFPGATRISEGKWDLRAWMSGNGLELSEDGFAHYERSGNKVVVRAPRDGLLLAGVIFAGSCTIQCAESPIDRIFLKAHIQWWRLTQKFFPPLPMPPVPAIPITPSLPRPDGIPGLDPIPQLPDGN